MYQYIAFHLLLTSVLFIFGFHIWLMPDDRASVFDYTILSHMAMIGAWPYGLWVAWVFRMPMNKRKIIEGVRTRKFNLAF